MNPDARLDEDWGAQESGPIDAGLALRLLARRLPRAELHQHLVGALRPSRVPGGPVARPDALLDYRGVSDFFARHQTFARSMRDPGAFQEATERVLEHALDAGCRHVELSVNATEFDGGLTVEQVLRRGTRAFEAVRARTGLTGGLIVGVARNGSDALALETVDQAYAARQDGLAVLGVGNDGAPLRPLVDFAPAVERARKHGLRVTAHANTTTDVTQALDLGLDRIDHAWELQARTDLQERAVAQRVPVTMAMTSCLMMLPGRFPTAASFPFDDLRAAGVAVSLHTDDAAMFFTDSAQELALGAQTYAWDGRTTADVALASLEAAWIDDDRDTRLARWRAEADALVRDPRAPAVHS